MKIQIISVVLLLCIYMQVAICKQRLDVLGLYPRSGDGWTEPFVKYTAELALKHISENTNLLNDYQIVIDWKNTQCDGGIALKQFIDALGKNQNQTYLVVFGAGCSVATSQVAVISYRYGLVQIAFASTAPNPGNNVLYPRFVRGVPSDLKAVPARARFIQQNNWKRVAIINEQDPIFVSSSHYMENVLDLLNVDYKVEDITLDGTVPLEQQVSILANNLRGYRIIIANMYEDAAIKLFCYLYKQKEKYLLPNIATWLFLGWFTDQWHDKQGVLEEVGCTAEQIATASNGALGFLVVHSKKHFMGQTNNNQVTIANRTTAELYQEYKELILERINNDTVRFDREFDVHDAYVYDSIWTLALAMQNASDEGFNLTEISQKQNLEDTNIFSKNSEFSSAVYNGMLYQNFIGWTGNVRFSGYERLNPQVQILEFVDGNLVYRGDCENIPYFDDFTEDSINSIMCSLDETFTYWNKETATDEINNMYTSEAIVALGVLLSLCIFAYVTFLIIVIIVGKWEKLESIIITCINLARNTFRKNISKYEVTRKQFHEVMLEFNNTQNLLIKDISQQGEATRKFFIKKVNEAEICRKVFLKVTQKDEINTTKFIECMSRQDETSWKMLIKQLALQDILPNQFLNALSEQIEATLGMFLKDLAQDVPAIRRKFFKAMSADETMLKKYITCMSEYESTRKMFRKEMSLLHAAARTNFKEALLALDKKIQDKFPKDLSNSPDYLNYPFIEGSKAQGIIIVNKKFKGNQTTNKKHILEDREGADKERGYLQDIYKQYDIDYEGNDHFDLKGEEISGKLEDFANKVSDKSPPVIFISIASHGGGKGICGIDGNCIHMKDIEKIFTDNEQLLGIPKVFLIQACRNGNMDIVYDIEDNKAIKKGKQVTTKISDVLTAYATSNGTRAFRNEKGSWFFQELRECVLNESYKNRHFQELLTICSDQLIDECVEEHKNFTETPSYVSTLRKFLMFPQKQSQTRS